MALERFEQSEVGADDTAALSALRFWEGRRRKGRPKTLRVLKREGMGLPFYKFKSSLDCLFI